MRVLVTGGKGQLGSDVLARLAACRIEAIGADKAEFDITDRAQTARFLRECRPDAVIHCAAYTDVNRAEDEEELCRRINAEGTANIAQACEDVGAKLIYISTDYVFDGSGTLPHLPDEQVGPLNVYGQTKWEGEQAALRACTRTFIVRTSWVFGKNGGNFVKTMLRLSEEHPELRVVDDQIGAPTYTKDLAVLLCDMVQSARYGIYHATNEGECSWADFAREIMRVAGRTTKIVPVPSDAYPTKAIRPLNSRLSKDCLDAAGFQRLPAWEDALRRFWQELK